MYVCVVNFKLNVIQVITRINSNSVSVLESVNYKTHENIRYGLVTFI